MRYARMQGYQPDELIQIMQGLGDAHPRPRGHRGGGPKPLSERRAAGSAAVGGAGWPLLVLVLVVAAVVVPSSREVVLPARVHQRPCPARRRKRRVNGPSLGLATSYQLTGPTGVAVDQAGDIYFTDGNRVYEVVRATQQLEVVAGTGAPGFSGDGGPGPQATLRPERRRSRSERRRLLRRRQSRPQGLGGRRCHLHRGRGRAHRLQRERGPGRQGLSEFRPRTRRRWGPERLHRRGSRR